MQPQVCEHDFKFVQDNHSKIFCHMEKRDAKRTYFHSKLAENIKDAKLLFTLVDHVLHRNCDRFLPDHTSANCLVNTFIKYFLDKISNLRAKLDGSTTNNINTSTITFSDLHTPRTSTKISEKLYRNRNKAVWLRSYHNFND